LADVLEPSDITTGTAIQNFNIKNTNVTADGYEVLLNINLNSGYELENVKLLLTQRDLSAYETYDIQEGVKYALGFNDTELGG
jgi:hypothetical protein